MSINNNYNNSRRMGICLESERNNLPKIARKPTSGNFTKKITGIYFETVTPTGPENLQGILKTRSFRKVDSFASTMPLSRKNTEKMIPGKLASSLRERVEQMKAVNPSELFVNGKKSSFERKPASLRNLFDLIPKSTELKEESSVAKRPYHTGTPRHSFQLDGIDRPRRGAIAHLGDALDYSRSALNINPNNQTH